MANLTHGGCSGGRNSPEYQSYSAMLHRCYNPERSNYGQYGGSGIEVCDRWRGPEGFSNFVADMGSRPFGTSLDRRDGTLGYTPENCRWSGRQVQNYNTNLKKIKTLSKYRGVSFSSSRNRPWIARIGSGVRGKYIWLGDYHTEDEAAAAYNKAAKEMHGPEAKLNDIRY